MKKSFLTSIGALAATLGANASSTLPDSIPSSDLSIKTIYQQDTQQPQIPFVLSRAEVVSEKSGHGSHVSGHSQHGSHGSSHSVHVSSHISSWKN